MRGKKEDYPKLEPYFNWENYRVTHPTDKIPWPNHVKESFDYYKKCCKEYTDKEFEKRDAVANIREDDLFEAFLLDYYGFIQPVCPNDSTNEPVEDVLNEEITRETLNKIEFLPDVNLSFPLIVTGFIDSDSDRTGKTSALCIDIVEKKEFDGE